MAAPDFRQYRAEFPAFMGKAMAYAAELGFDVRGLQIDHVGLRVRLQADVDALRVQMADAVSGGTRLSAAVVHGRTITIYKLHQGLVHEGLIVPCVELPDPKANHDYPEDGIEHAEFVIPSSDATVAEFERTFLARFPHARGYTTDMPSPAHDRIKNPTIVFEKYRGLSLKFHPAPIDVIVDPSNQL